jgi:hypothetical protein
MTRVVFLANPINVLEESDFYTNLDQTGKRHDDTDDYGKTEDKRQRCSNTAQFRLVHDAPAKVKRGGIFM